MDGACKAPTIDKIVGHNFIQKISGDLVIHERIILKNWSQGNRALRRGQDSFGSG
jgi:hypothetical protein